MAVATVRGTGMGDWFPWQYEWCTCDRDLVLVTGGGHQLGLNRIVLAARSQYLRRLLTRREEEEGVEEIATFLLQDFCLGSVKCLTELLTTGTTSATHAEITQLSHLIQTLGLDIRIARVGSGDLEGYRVVTSHDSCGQKVAAEGGIEPNKGIKVDPSLSSSEKGLSDCAIIKNISCEETEVAENEKMDCDDQAEKSSSKSADSSHKTSRSSTEQSESSTRSSTNDHRGDLGEKEEVGLRQSNKYKTLQQIFSEYSIDFDKFIQRQDRGSHKCLYPMCDKVYKARDDAASHLFKHLDIKPYTCEECRAGFSGRGDLKYHLVTHNKRHSCTECPKVFATQQKLLVHMRTHTGEKPFVCDDCGFRTNLGSTLKSHQRTHTNERPKVCTYPECGEAFTFGSQLKRHREVVHGEDSDKTWCPDCGEQLRTTADLSKHRLRRHSDSAVSKVLPRKFVCTVCNKGWTTKSALKSHMTRHTGQYNFSCDICSQLFKTKSQVYQHKRDFHVCVKEHVCHHCGKAFHAKSILAAHVRIHTGERPFKCRSCDERFAVRITMKSHEARVHGIEHEKKRVQRNHPPNFTCTFSDCGRQFYSQPRLQMHARKHTTQTCFRCQLCSAEFDTQAKARSHERKQHKVFRRKHVSDLICGVKEERSGMYEDTQ